jgi:alpha-tubulin suppressor-like RCC1 family protein
MSRPLPRRLAALRALLSMALLSACSDSGASGEGVDASSAHFELGDLRVVIALPEELELEQVEVEVSGEGFRYLVEVAAAPDASFTLTVPGVPAGSGYQVRVVHAVSPVAGAVRCSVDDSFEVGANQTNVVDVELECEPDVESDAGLEDAGADPDGGLDGGSEDAEMEDAQSSPDVEAAADADAQQDSGPSSCPSGHLLVEQPVRRCVDIDECTDNAGGCSNRTCVNGDGSFACVGRPRVVQLATGRSHACALVSDGRVFCWGGNWTGAVGDGTAIDRLTPTRAASIVGAMAITTGDGFTCALLRSGRVSCWGQNWQGQLGDGTTATDYIAARRFFPTAVAGLSGVTAIAGSHSRTCALLASGKMRCWGAIQSGAPLSQEMTVVDRVVAIATGAHHHCAELADGRTVCWGSNGNGQIGNGKNFPIYNRLSQPAEEPVPVEVAGLGGVTQLAASDWRTCAVLESGSLRCWGTEATYYVPDGASNLLVPSDVPGLSGVRQVANGAFHVCARLESGQVQCWGRNHNGAVGDGTLQDRPLPTPVLGLADAIDITVADGYSCALSGSGAVHCWGFNSQGQLGDGTRITRPVPTPVDFGFLGDASLAPAQPGRPILCPTLTVPPNGAIAYSAATSVGSVATYTCDSGFTPRPASLQRTCRPGSQGLEWDGESVRCMSARCGDGLVSAGEECDPDAPNENLWTCSSSCRRLRDFKRCADGPSCPAGQQCVAGMCTPTCQDGSVACPALPAGAPAQLSAECQPEQPGGTGSCFVEGCRTYADCPSGAICAGGRCTGCSESSQCPPELPTCVPVAGLGAGGGNCQR